MAVYTGGTQMHLTGERACDLTFVLFAPLFAGCSGDHRSSTLLASRRGSAGSLQSEMPPRPVETARSSINVRADEM